MWGRIRKRNCTWNQKTAATVTDDPSYPGTCCRIFFVRARAQWSSVWSSSLASSWSVQVTFYAVSFSSVDTPTCTHNRRWCWHSASSPDRRSPTPCIRLRTRHKIHKELYTKITVRAYCMVSPGKPANRQNKVQINPQQTPFAVQIPPTSVSSPTELSPATSNTQ